MKTSQAASSRKATLNQAAVVASRTGALEVVQAQRRGPRIHGKREDEQADPATETAMHLQGSSECGVFKVQGWWEKFRHGLVRAGMKGKRCFWGCREQRLGTCYDGHADSRKRTLKFGQRGAGLGVRLRIYMQHSTKPLTGKLRLRNIRKCSGQNCIE